MFHKAQGAEAYHLVLQRVFPLHSFQKIEVGKHLAGTQHDGSQWIVCDETGKPVCY